MARSKRQAPKSESQAPSPKSQKVKARLYRVLECVKFNGQLLHPGDTCDFAGAAGVTIQRLISEGWIEDAG